ncbi:unnamed protein product [Pleuronectes platessa]|uniref:Pseudouridine synthase I TruA alpha/beta domain-containing protein n=1 Tax=Pleuronectes platessa TaxID=8262 RepID=A0A9N7VHT4_PLEPL|nr:unnamed protein product [Pleuronectes platessa]
MDTAPTENREKKNSEEMEAEAVVQLEALALLQPVEVASGFLQLILIHMLVEKLFGDEFGSSKGGKKKPPRKLRCYSNMSEALTRQIKDLEAELEELRSRLRERTGSTEDLEVTSGENADHKPHGKSGGCKKGRKANKGFAVQENTDNTVEARLFEALLKTRLIQDRQSSNYHRCGRTDKGVSAFSQVITIDLRSTQFSGGLGVTLPENIDENIKSKAAASEVPYVKMLNRVLPQDIRILDWAPVAEGFSARFDCKSRTYRYYFPRGSLDVALMADAAKRYEGTHDFRNLCKMDVGNGVLQFQRTILSASIKPALPEHTSSTDQYDIFIFEIKGLAFLYHQVRCMMALLLLIGQKLEAPELIHQLLDVQSNPRKHSTDCA